MNNLDKYKKAFVEGLSVEESKINDNLKYNDIPEWDSIGHMTLMSNLEEAFKVTLETDDIVDFSSFKKGKEILNKYKINF
tara:strand:- start:228 stop:467 length:240 start_codon:yes stop_codon:yes gene_type:complete